MIRLRPLCAPSGVLTLKWEPIDSGFAKLIRVAPNGSQIVQEPVDGRGSEGGLGELFHGFGELFQGLGELFQGLGELFQGLDELFQGLGELFQGLGELFQGLGELVVPGPGRVVLCFLQVPRGEFALQR